MAYVKKATEYFFDDQNMEIDFNKLTQKFNEYESSEVEFEKDILLGNLDEETLTTLEAECNIRDDSLPSLSFINEDQEEIQQIKNIETLLSCKNCGRLYKRKSFLEKHILVCGKLTSSFEIRENNC